MLRTAPGTIDNVINPRTAIGHFNLPNTDTVVLNCHFNHNVMIFRVKAATCSYSQKSDLEGTRVIESGTIGPYNLFIKFENGVTVMGQLDDSLILPGGQELSGVGVWTPPTEAGKA
jgi:hypothetical protein